MSINPVSSGPTVFQPLTQAASSGEGTPAHEASESLAEKMAEGDVAATPLPAAGPGKGQNLDTVA